MSSYFTYLSYYFTFSFDFPRSNKTPTQRAGDIFSLIAIYSVVLLSFPIHVLVVLVEERHHLSSQALALRPEGIVVVACDYLHLGCPDRCLVEVVFAVDVSELAGLGFGLRLARHPPEERYRLGSGADALRVELVLRYACGDALFDGPEDGLVEIIRLLYIREITGGRI